MRWEIWKERNMVKQNMVGQNMVKENMKKFEKRGGKGAWEQRIVWKDKTKKQKTKAKPTPLDPALRFASAGRQWKTLKGKKTPVMLRCFCSASSGFFYRFVRAADTLDRLNEVKRSETECQATSYRLSANFQHSSVLFTCVKCANQRDVEIQGWNWKTK